jgi:hypothetical protein
MGERFPRSFNQEGESNMSEYIYKSKTLDNGYTVKVVQDDDPESPREWDNAGTVAILSRCRYHFGDKHLSHEELDRIANDKSNIVLPVYIYDHSGITINTTGFSCRWDSRQVGIIYISRKDAVKEWGKKMCTASVVRKAREYLKGEIETLDQYLSGSVYGYRVLDPKGNETDSCWGFYGEVDYCLSEGVSVAMTHEGATA